MPCMCSSRWARRYVAVRAFGRLRRACRGGRRGRARWIAAQRAAIEPKPGRAGSVDPGATVHQASSGTTSCGCSGSCCSPVAFVLSIGLRHNVANLSWRGPACAGELPCGQAVGAPRGAAHSAICSSRSRHLPSPAHLGARGRAGRCRIIIEQAGDEGVSVLDEIEMNRVVVFVSVAITVLWLWWRASSPPSGHRAPSGRVAQGDLPAPRPTCIWADCSTRADRVQGGDGFFAPHLAGLMIRDGASVRGGRSALRPATISIRAGIGLFEGRYRRRGARALPDELTTALRSDPAVPRPAVTSRQRFLPAYPVQSARPMRPIVRRWR